ncbi:MAG TPA: response regulator [Terriglobales bacterium]|nr:response regulator [Terriglobales bacterium]
MHRLQDTKLAILFLGTIVALVTVGIVGYRQTAGFTVNAHWVSHTYIVIQSVEQVLAELGAAEAEQRDFLLTGDQPYLDAFHMHSARVWQHLEDLNQLTKDNPVQQRRLAGIEPLLRARLQRLEQGAALRQSKGEAAAIEFVRSSGGPQLSRDARMLLDDVVEEERTLLQDREAMAQADARSVAIILLAGGGFSVLLVIFIFLRLNREVAIRRHFQDEAERRKHEVELRSQEVERANQLKSQFLASMSHELRTPLNAILGFSELLKDQVAGPLQPKQVRWVEHIQRGGRHLLQLINDILDLSKIEAGQVELAPETFALAAGLGEVLSTTRPLAMTKRITVRSSVAPGIAVYADRTRVKQVLYNLLSNAIKFTPEGGSVTIEAVNEGKMVRCSVTDTGVGISEEDQKVIFEEFRQVGKASSGVTEGTGLGLAITRRLVAQHGGSLTVSSQPGAGSSFSFTLPAAELAAGIGPPPEAIEIAGSPEAPLVLVVDDEMAACELLVSHLSNAGYRTAVANSGKEALERARTLRPAVVTLDVLMPTGSGWETLFELRNTPETADIPVIVVSIVDQKKLGFSLGASDYLVKPVDREQLLDAVRRKTAGRPGQPLTCLAVDDDPDMLRLVREVLEPAGFGILSAANGLEALACLERENSVHVILLDLLMPEMDGFEVLERLHDNEGWRRIPVLVLTAKDLTPPERETVARRARALLHKSDEWQSRLLESVRNATAQGKNWAGVA